VGAHEEIQPVAIEELRGRYSLARYEWRVSVSFTGVAPGKKAVLG